MLNSAEIRQLWADYDCERSKMQQIAFGPDLIMVAPETVEAWRALETVLLAFGYSIRIGDTESFSCQSKNHKAQSSPHSFGIGLDINGRTNPFVEHAEDRAVRYSPKATQLERARDVKSGKADTDMAKSMVNAVLEIATSSGKKVFSWGGNQPSAKYPMLFQINVSPGDLAGGIDWSTVECGDHPHEINFWRPARQQQRIPDTSGGLPKVYFDQVRKSLFGGSLTQSAVNNMTTIIRYWLKHYSNAPLSQLAYVLATVRAEVGLNMAPVRESFASNDEIARRNLTHRKYARSAPPYGHAYYGRGYVQLTHQSNYAHQSRKLGIDLVKEPDRALNTDVAVKILVNGMMEGDFNAHDKGLAHYVNADQQDFVNARRTVNLLDRAREIARYARSFLAALEEAETVSGGMLGLEPDLDNSSDGFRHDTQSSYGTEFDTDDIDGVGYGDAFSAPASMEKRGKRHTSYSVPGLAFDQKQFRDLARSLGVEDRSIDKIERLLQLFQEFDRFSKPAKLTPVNGALGKTIGHWLDGRKTGIGIVSVLIAIFVPQLSPTLLSAYEAFAFSSTQDGSRALSDQSIREFSGEVLLPIACLFAGWGVLGKFDKWAAAIANRQMSGSEQASGVAPDIQRSG